MSENQIIKHSDCSIGLPIEIAASGEILIVTDIKEGNLICTNLTTLISRNDPLSLVNRSGNMTKADEAKVREQAKKEITVIKGAIAEHRKIIKALEMQAKQKLSLIKAVRDYYKK